MRATIVATMSRVLYGVCTILEINRASNRASISPTTITILSKLRKVRGREERASRTLANLRQSHETVKNLITPSNLSNESKIAHASRERPKIATAIASSMLRFLADPRQHESKQTKKGKRNTREGRGNVETKTKRGETGNFLYV